MPRSTSFLFLGVAAIFTATASGHLVRGAAAPAYRYAPAEAMRGKVVYAQNCAVCHGADMKGGDGAPPLIGVGFDAHWRDRPADLYLKVKQTMPQDDPGSLTPAQAADVVAALLQANHVPSGAITNGNARADPPR